MTFLHPLIFAAGLACIALPILIHFLMRRRRPPVRWAAMRFVLEAYRKRRRRVKLEQLLLLCARCLLIALLAGAIAVPVFGVAASGSSRPGLLVVAIDDSIAANARVGGRERLADLRQQALDELDTLRPERGDRVAIIGLGAPPRIILEPTRDVALARAALGELVASDARVDLAAGLALVNELSGPEGNGVAGARTLLLAAWSATTLGDAPSTTPLDNQRSVRVNAPNPDTRDPSANTPDNAAITVVAPDRRVVASNGQQTTLNVRVTVARSRTNANDAVAIPLSVVVRRVSDATLQASGSGVAQLDAGSATADVSVPVALGADELGSFVVEATISPTLDAISADNTRRAAVEVRPPLRVAVYGSRATGGSGVGSFTPTDWITAALSPSAGTRRPGASEGVGEGIAPIARSTASLVRTGPLEFDAIIITDPAPLDSRAWARLREHVDGAGVLVVMPSPDATTHAWTTALTQVFDAPFTVSRTPILEDPPAEISPIASTPGATTGSLLSRLGSELDDLTRPVRITRRLAITPTPSPTAPGGSGVLLAAGDADPWLVAWSPSLDRGQASPGSVSAGLVVLLGSAIDLEWTDLPARPLMVPLMHELVQRAVGASSTRAEHLAGTAPTPPAGTAAVRTEPSGFARRGDASESSPDIPLRFAGVGVALDTEGAPVGTVVTNPDTDPRHTEPAPLETIARLLDTIAPEGSVSRLDEEVTQTRQPATRRIAAWLFAGALVLLVVETLLARVASHASLAGTEPARVRVARRVAHLVRSTRGRAA